MPAGSWPADPPADARAGGGAGGGVARGGEAAVFFRLFSIRMYDAMQLCFLSKLCVCRNHEKS